MSTTGLLTRVGTWVLIAIGVSVGLAVLFGVEGTYGFGWAALAFAAVLAPFVAVARVLSRYVQRKAAVQHGPPLPPGVARYCARCGMETRLPDPTCNFCGGTRFLTEPPKAGTPA